MTELYEVLSYGQDKTKAGHVRYVR